MITDADMRRQVTDALQDYGAEFDVAGIVADLIERFGRVDVDSTPPEMFWQVVRERALCDQCQRSHDDTELCPAAGAELILGSRS